MTVEDRIRTATRARAGLVREIRPLELPERLPRRAVRAPRSRRLTGWLAPVTAAVSVVALAVALVSVHQARNGSGSPGSVQAPPAGGAAIPRYYVAVSPRISGAPLAATVADSRTGAVLATVRPPAPRGFAGVTGAAGDRTFVLDTASKGSDFVKASRSVVADPGDRHGCSSLLTATDGRTVVCGTLGNATGGCVKEEPEFDLWSTATGKLTRVLYRYRGTCQAASAGVLWAGPSGTVIGVIAAYTHTGKQPSAPTASPLPPGGLTPAHTTPAPAPVHTRITAVLISHGRFTPLRIAIPLADFSPGAIAF